MNDSNDSVPSLSAGHHIPKGLVGALFGGLGALPLLPIASGLAIRFSAVPALPGAERRLGDIKTATYAEAAVLLVAVPLAALFFAHVYPRFLELVVPVGRLSFEWAASGFALSFWLAQRGVRPKHALAAGVVAALLLTAGIAAFRSSFRLRRFFARRHRPIWLRLALAGASLDLARRATPFAPRNLLDDLAVELALSALVLPLLLAVICLVFAQRPTFLFRRFGHAAAFSITLAAAGIVVPTASRVFAVAGLASFLAAPLTATARLPRWMGRAALLLLLLACGWRILRVPGSPIEIFEDGCSLAFAEAYLNGATPYVDTSPLHGWGADGGVDAFLFRLTRPTLEIFQLRQAAWATLAFGLLALSGVVALGAGWGALAFLFGLSILPLPIERQTLAFASLLFLLASARWERRLLAIAAGVLAAWESLYSLDYGLFLCAGGLTGLLLLPLLESGFRSFREKVRAGLRWAGSFAFGILIGALPFLAILISRGGLPAFFRVSFLEISRWADAAWGLPAGSAWRALLQARTGDSWIRVLAGEGMSSLSFLIVLAVTGVALLLRSLTGRFDPADRAGWISFLVAAFAMRAVLGRADPLHLVRYGVLTALPAAWLLLRASRAAGPRAAFLLATVLFLSLRLHPFQTLESELDLVEGAARRDRAATGERAPRSGGALLPREQAATLTRFRQYLDARLAPGETFFDFSNRPALYFVADRRIPIRYHTVAQYEAPEKQREVIRDLERKKPPIAILASGSYGGLDGVTNMDRAPEVARYLSDHYEPDSVIDDLNLARRKAAP